MPSACEMVILATDGGFERSYPDDVKDDDWFECDPSAFVDTRTTKN